MDLGFWARGRRVAPNSPSTLYPVVIDLQTQWIEGGRNAGAPATIRLATPADLGALERLEGTSFATDWLSRRQFRYLLTRAPATTLVAAAQQAALAADRASLHLGIRGDNLNSQSLFQ